MPTLTRGAVQARLIEVTDLLGGIRYNLQQLGRELGGEVADLAADLRQAEHRLNCLIAQGEDAHFN